MSNAVIISQNQDLINHLREFFLDNSIEEICVCDSGDKARKVLQDKDFDYIFIDREGKSEEEFAIDFSRNYMCQIIIFVEEDMFEYIVDQMSEYGIITIEKPLDLRFLQLCYKLSVAFQNRFIKIDNENKKLLSKIEEIKLVNKAKAHLIKKYKISEEDAHKLIEHQAMNLRKTKAQIANIILNDK